MLVSNCGLLYVMLCSHALITPTNGSRNSMVTARPASMAPTSGSVKPAAMPIHVRTSAAADTPMRNTNALPSTVPSWPGGRFTMVGTRISAPHTQVMGESTSSSVFAYCHLPKTSGPK